MRVAIVAFFVLVSLVGYAQTSFCPEDPPVNPWLADSPYPIYHRNNYAQASTCIAGPTPNDSIVIKLRTEITGGPSPWLYFSDTYPDGQRAILFSNSNFVYKFLDDGDDLVAIDSLRIDFDPTTTGYNFLLSRNKVWFTYDPAYNPAQNRYTRLFKLTDADTTDIYSDIVVLDTLDFGDYGINKVSMYNVNYNGEIVFYSHEDLANGIFNVGVIDQDLNMVAHELFDLLPNEIVNHNSIAVDENNAFYIVSTHRLIQFTWDGTTLAIGWQALYDFVNDGPTGNFANGSGTTPTLMGWGDGNDKLVVVADGHAQNNLVAFWRELPDGWQGISGMDIHFADSLRIPYAQSFGNLFQSIENSPTAFGYDVAIAQYNGFFAYACENAKGVQKFRRDTATDQLTLQWATDSVNMNGVLSYSSGSNLVYGTGKESDCNYYYYALDWDTGELAMRILLGPEGNFPSDPFFDQGVNHIIDEAGNIYFSGSRSLVKLEKYPLSVSTNDAIPNDRNLHLFPNPTQGILHIAGDLYANWNYAVLDVTGRVVGKGRITSNTIDLSGLPDGIYTVQLTNGTELLNSKVALSAR